MIISIILTISVIGIILGALIALTGDSIGPIDNPVTNFGLGMTFLSMFIFCTTLVIGCMFELPF